MATNALTDMLPHEVEKMMGYGIEGEERPQLDIIE
jgi:hypothetical protein